MDPMNLEEVVNSGISMTTLEEVFMALGEQAFFKSVTYTMSIPKSPLAKGEIRLAHITSLHVHTVDGRNPAPLLITRDFL